MKIEVILSPAELPALAKRDLRETVCAVFDILRATSTFVTMLHHGAREIIPVSEISEALQIKKTRPDILLAGERHGLKICASGIDFDLGNSPREFTPEKIRDKTIVSTTTNGTRALRACTGAKTVLASSFLNLKATAQFLQEHKTKNVLLICAGTGKNKADEDILAAGALMELLTARGDARPTASNSAEAARNFYLEAKSHLADAVSNSENAQRLLAISELRDDVSFCLQRDIFPLVAQMTADGIIRR
ncbi:MAG TPA: 2-phosphosulfolactate phosphatase [Verrucomicrobiae bacterium]|nr:2-phosphosulfolactate phosphatase [Verrucomicrobiae bacterium]